MKKTRRTNKLKLNKATVSNLDRRDMFAVNGGDTEGGYTNAVMSCSIWSEKCQPTQRRGCTQDIHQCCGNETTYEDPTDVSIEVCPV